MSENLFDKQIEGSRREPIFGLCPSNDKSLNYALNAIRTIHRKGPRAGPRLRTGPWVGHRGHNRTCGKRSSAPPRFMTVGSL